jgi:hypothetical protein
LSCSSPQRSPDRLGRGEGIRRLLRFTVGVAVIGMALSACSSSSAVAPVHHHRHGARPATTTTTAPVSTTTTAPAASSTTTAPVSTTTSTTTVTTSSACPPTSFSLVLSHSSGTAGTLFLAYELTNETGSTCDLKGYPTITLYASGDASASSGALPITVLDGGSGVLGDPVATVSIAPKATAGFVLSYSDIGTGVCRGVGSIRAVLPGASESLGAPANFELCAPTARVSPVLSEVQLAGSL